MGKKEIPAVEQEDMFVLPIVFDRELSEDELEALEDQLALYADAIQVKCSLVEVEGKGVVPIKVKWR